MLKVELHAHTADDPRDYIGHSALQLIDRASELAYDAIAITLHNKQLDLDPYRGHAARRTLTLIPGVERDIEGKHVLLLNFSLRAEDVRSFADLAELRGSEPAGLVVAPHPFYPATSCLGRALTRHAHLFDAVEQNAMYAPGLDFNRAARRWAEAHDKPMVGNCDVHRLEQLGTTYSRVDADRSPGAICEAIRQGRVEVETAPLPWLRAAWIFAKILPTGVLRSVRQGLGMPIGPPDAEMRSR